MNHESGFLATLELLKRTSLRFRTTKPVSIDLGVRLSKDFLALDASHRVSASAEVDTDTSFKLLVVSGYMAESAIDERSKLYVDAAITMHLIEDFRVDYRENYRYLVLIYQAAKQIGISFNDEVLRLSTYMSTRAENYLKAFCERDPKLNELGLFGIKQSIKDGATMFAAEPNQFRKS